MRYDPEHLLGLAANRNVIRDVVEAAVAKPSRKRRVRAARLVDSKNMDLGSGDALDEQLDHAFPIEPAEVDSTDEPVARADSSITADDEADSPDPDDLDVDDWEIA